MADVQAEFEIMEPELTKPTFEVVDENGVQKVEIIGFSDPEVSPEDVAGREVTVRKAIVLGNGRININELTAYVENKVASVMSMDVATADEQDIKKAQATLNKTAKELSDVRIAMQKVWSQPFEQNIAGPIKKLVAFIDEQKQPIASKLDEIAEAYKNARLADIREIKDERLAKESEAVDKYIRSLPWFDDDKWLNKTMWGASGQSVTKVAKEIDEKVTQVVADINAIGMLSEDDPFGPQLMDAYRNNGGNLANTLLERKKLEQAAEQYARVQADIKAKQEAQRIEQEKADAEAAERREAFAQGGVVHIGTTEVPKFMQADEPEMVVDLPPVQEQEKVYVVTFKIKATKNQMASVISHMKGLGVAYSLVDHKEA
jgi:hypothetical protein